MHPILKSFTSAELLTASIEKIVEEKFKDLVPQPEPPIIKTERCIIVGNGDSYFVIGPHPQDHDCMSNYNGGHVPFVFDCRAEAEDWINKRTQTEWGSAKEYYQIKPAPEGHKSLGYADENYGKSQREKALVAEYVAEIDRLNRELNAALCRAEQIDKNLKALQNKSREEEELELENEMLKRKIERDHEIREMGQDSLFAENARLKNIIAELEKHIK